MPRVAIKVPSCQDTDLERSKLPSIRSTQHETVKQAQAQSFFYILDLHFPEKQGDTVASGLIEPVAPGCKHRAWLAQGLATLGHSVSKGPNRILTQPGVTVTLANERFP